MTKDVCGSGLVRIMGNKPPCMDQYMVTIFIWAQIAVFAGVFMMATVAHTDERADGWTDLLSETHLKKKESEKNIM